MKEAAQNLYTDRANRSTSLSWAFGGISVGIKNNLLGVWILFYYNQVLGLDAYLVSIALAGICFSYFFTDMIRCF